MQRACAAPHREGRRLGMTGRRSTSALPGGQARHDRRPPCSTHLPTVPFQSVPPEPVRWNHAGRTHGE